MEWLVAISLTVMLGLAAVPFTADWIRSADCRTAASVLGFGFAKARAVAMRNPSGTVQGTAAGGLKIALSNSQALVLVCSGSAGAATCVNGGSTVLWSANYRATVSTTLGGSTLSSSTPITVDVDNRGKPLSATSYSLSLGGASEAGTLY